MKRILLPIWVLMMAGWASAQPPPGVKLPGPWSVGAGAIYQSSPYRGGEDKLIPIPLITYRGERLRVMGPFAEYVLIPGKQTELVLNLKLDFEGYEEDDSDVLDGLGDRKATLNAGVSVDHEFDHDISVKVGLLREVLSRHDGWIGEISLGKSFKNRGNFIRPAVFLRWLDSRYTDYYYGVSPSKARDNRPAYNPSEGAVYGVAVSVARSFYTRSTKPGYGVHYGVFRVHK